MKPMVGHVIGMVATFVVAVLCVLALKGMLTFAPPFIVAPSSAKPADSATAAPESASPGPAGEEHGENASADSTRLALADSAGTQSLDTALDSPDWSAPDTTGADTPAEDAAPEVPAGESQKLSRVVRVYEKMRPKQVAQIMDTLPDAHSVAILAGMSDRVAAKVISSMDPANAARLSEILMSEGRR